MEALTSLDLPAFMFTTTMKLSLRLAHFLVPLFCLQTDATRGCNDVLKYGTPESVGLFSEPLLDMVQNLTNFTKPGYYGKFSKYAVHPIQPGGVTLVAHNATIVSHFSFGKKSLYASGNGTLLPASRQEDATLDTIYDLASVSKVFAATMALIQHDQGRLDFDATVASYLPEFAVHGKENITVLQLVTHTSGLAPDPSPPLWTGYETYDERIQAILDSTLQNTPGTTYVYSDINFMTLMLILETVSGGQKLPDLLKAITGPLAMTSTFYNEGNLEGPRANPHYWRHAPTEFEIELLDPGEPVRPQPVRGSVHDENAWSLNGVSGHAGLFSTAGDLSRFCQMILNNGTYGGRRVLSQKAVDLMFTDFNAYLGASGTPHSIGFELNQYYVAGPLNTSSVAVHAGFTGTSIVVDRGRNLFYIHLANRVHPSRNWSSNNIVRETVGYWVGRALGWMLPFQRSCKPVGGLSRLIGP